MGSGGWADGIQRCHTALDINQFYPLLNSSGQGSRCLYGGHYEYGRESRAPGGGTPRFGRGSGEIGLEVQREAGAEEQAKEKERKTSKLSNYLFHGGTTEDSASAQPGMSTSINCPSETFPSPLSPIDDLVSVCGHGPPLLPRHIAASFFLGTFGRRLRHFVADGEY